jgi:PadR family transcriptional regulator, regulatory protein PadR
LIGSSVDNQQDDLLTANMTPDRLEVLQGTLDMLVLRILDGMGSLHGYGIARRIEQVSGDVLALNQGTLYPALLRLEQQGWIQSEWGTSDNNRRARYYSLTRGGRRQLATEVDRWQRICQAVNQVLSVSSES